MQSQTPAWTAIRLGGWLGLAEYLYEFGLESWTFGFSNTTWVKYFRFLHGKYERYTATPLPATLRVTESARDRRTVQAAGLEQVLEFVLEGSGDLE